MIAVMSPPRNLREASSALASGKQIGTSTLVMKDATLISRGHSRHNAVETPGLPQAKNSPLVPFFNCKSQANPTDFLCRVAEQTNKVSNFSNLEPLATKVTKERRPRT